MDLGVIKKEEKPTMTASLLCTWICEIQWPEGIIGEITGLEAIRVEKQRRQWQPTPVLLPGKSHGWRSLVGCSPRGRKESDTTERLHFHFSLWCIGEGNGNTLQCSCLGNAMDRGAWRATVHGVSKTQTWLSNWACLHSASTTKTSAENLWVKQSSLTVYYYTGCQPWSR